MRCLLCVALYYIIIQGDITKVRTQRHTFTMSLCVTHRTARKKIKNQKENEKLIELA